MIKVSKETTKRLLDIHGWSAVILGLALYVVVFTGAIVVFAHEIGVWSVSGHKMDGALAGKIDAKMTEIAKTVDPAYFEEVAIWQNSAGYIISFFHHHVKNDQGKLAEKGSRFVIDPVTMNVVSREDGFSKEMPPVTSGYLESFFADLHIRLHAPDPVGLYLTGVLGLVLLILAISGFILHRHLIMDIFLSPRLTTRLLNTRDRHNLAGTWGIIFSFILAFTGAFFSFATTLGLPVIAITAFEGDQQKAIETVMGMPAQEDKTLMPFVGLEKVIARVQQQDAAGSLPRFVVVMHMGRADAKVMTTHNPSDETIFFKNYVFNGVTGEYLGEKPRVGTKPSLGNNLIGLMSVLHFGWFAGLLSRIIWLSLGLATCYVTLTGLQLWVQRRESEPFWQRLGRLIGIIGYGTPLAMSCAAIGFLMSYAQHPAWVQNWTVKGFFIGAALSFAIGLLLKTKRTREICFQCTLGLTLVGLPLIRYMTSHVTWLMEDSAAVIGLDISLVLTGLLLILVSTGWKQQTAFTKSEEAASAAGA